MFCMALIFSESGWTPSGISTWPMYVTLVTPNLHFSSLSVRLTVSHHQSTASRRSSCSAFVVPHTKILSISVLTPGRSPNTWLIRF